MRTGSGNRSRRAGRRERMNGPQGNYVHAFDAVWACPAGFPKRMRSVARRHTSLSLLIGMAGEGGHAMGERIISGGYFWEGSSDSCLVLPGLSGADKARRLGDEIHQSGFSVSMPLLTYCLETSDGPTPSNWRTWLDDAREAYTRLNRQMASVAVAGIGVGGALALILAAEYPVSAVVAVAPTLRMPGMLGFWGPPPDCEGGTGSVRMRDIRAVARLARRSLFAVIAPALIVEPVKGGFVHPGSATRAYADVSSREKRIEWLEKSRREFPGDAEFKQALAAIRDHLRPSGGQNCL